MLSSVEMDLFVVLPSLFLVMLASFLIRARGGSLRILGRSIAGVGDAAPWSGRIAKASADEDDNAEYRVISEERRDDTSFEEMQLHKELYFKLQNLEQYPEILPQSLNLLVSLFSETLAAAHKEPRSSVSILSVGHYTQEKLERFLQRKNDEIAELWEQYLARRKAGSPREMFGDREESRWWVKQLAPVKYVDGAWLGHINKITTPFALRRVTKAAWQVLSEELGDGDAEKNHVHVYRDLMREIQADIPDADNHEFILPQHKLDQPCVWKSALAQLLISLFPHHFLPEILGFNMHFEMITQETLKAAKELKEVKLNPYYFILHISIDNADSGHTAIAMQTVVDYIQHVQKTGGDSAAQQAWKRVQAGYILSDELGVAPECPSVKRPAVDSFPRDQHEAKVIEIFQRKVSAAYKIHCSSTMRIGRRTLVEWLDPAAFASKQWRMGFLDDLSNQKPWVRKGNSANSKLIRELRWGGKMFGSFTQAEVEAVKAWIDSMGACDPHLYWAFVGRAEITQDEVFRDQDISVDYPVFLPTTGNNLSIPPMHFSTLPPPSLDSVIRIPSIPKASQFLPLWFTHPCLLEAFVCVPAKTTTKTASAIVRFLRAQSGFDVEGPGVAGMDEVRRTESVGVVELGLEMTRSCGLPEPACLKDVLRGWPSEFALRMLHWSMRPMANAGLLLGLAWAFVGLHDAMASSTLLSASSREVLRQMAARERDSLRICLEELQGDELVCKSFWRGYSLGKKEIEEC
ncbi:MAG: hypothetical protein M1816_003680 [Peltula sp. TS41687]|nr:MAG: hypothetical protein M1816_003680 [Peltula sp. TS41687]